LKIFLTFLTLILFTACDFSSSLHKEIVRAQKKISQQQYDAAAIIYENILKKNPSPQLKVKIYYQLGKIYSVNLANGEKAIEFLGLIEKEIEDPLWIVKSKEEIGEISFSITKNYSKAIDVYQILASFTPKLSKQDFYQFRLGQSYFQNNDYNNARKIFMGISNEVSNEYYKDSFYYLGLCSFQEKKWKSAINYWRDYLLREDRPDLIIEAKFLMANAYETMEELQMAYDIYYSILGQYPNPEVIKNRLKSLYARHTARKR